MKGSSGKFLIAFTVLFALLFQVGLANALSPEQQQLFSEGIDYFNADTCASGSGGVTLGGPDGSGPLYGPTFPKVANTQDLANRINTYISSSQPDSPFVGLGAQFVSAGVQYNINPAMIVGFAVKESSLGVNIVSGSYDAFGLTGRAADGGGDIPGAPYENGIIYFPSWQASINPETKYVSDAYIHGGFNASSILELMEHYTPGTASNPDVPEQQTQLTLDVMHKILSGIATTGGVTQDDSVDQTQPTTCSDESGFSSADCPTATTTGEELLCAAEKFNGRAYVWGGGHQGAAAFMQAFNAGNYEGLDCSGLVGVAVYNAFGIDDVQLAANYADDPHWQKIPVDQAQPGDVLYSSSHIEFVVRNEGNGNFLDFAAHDPLQGIGFDQITTSTFPHGLIGALRFNPSPGGGSN